MIGRREFITLLGGAGVAWPLAARAQQAGNVPRIGYMVTGSLESPDQRVLLDAFRQGLREHGYVEGQNIVVDYRAADGKIERFPEVARELVRLSPDLIWANNTPAARAAKQATTTIHEIGAELGVTRERARQMVAMAKKQLAFRIFKGIPRPRFRPPHPSTIAPINMGRGASATW
jgi:ABC-type sugar transport system substrate-binding protein